MKRTVLLLLVLLASHPAWTKPRQKSSASPLILKHADRMKNYGHGDKMWTHLVGNVEFLHGKVRLQSQIADYYRAEQRIEFQDQVMFSVEGRRLTADYVSYRKSEQRVVARGHVVINDSVEWVTLTGEWGDYFRDERIANLYGRPRLHRVDEAKGDTLVIESDSMTHEETEAETFAQGNVIITSGKIRATAGKGRFLHNDNKAFLSESPQFFVDSSYVTGKLIEILIRGEEFEKISVFEESLGRYVDSRDSAEDNRITEVKGDTIHMALENGAIRQVRVLWDAISHYFEPGHKATADVASGQFIRMELDKSEVREVVINGNAASTYYSRDEEDKSRVTGKNVASGDTICVSFQDDRVSSVTVYGAARGTYFMSE